MKQAFVASVRQLDMHIDAWKGPSATGYVSGLVTNELITITTSDMKRTARYTYLHQKTALGPFRVDQSVAYSPKPTFDVDVF